MMQLGMNIRGARAAVRRVTFVRQRYSILQMRAKPEMLLYLRGSRRSAFQRNGRSGRDSISLPGRRCVENDHGVVVYVVYCYRCHFNSDRVDDVDVVTDIVVGVVVAVVISMSSGLVRGNKSRCMGRPYLHGPSGSTHREVHELHRNSGGMGRKVRAPIPPQPLRRVHLSPIFSPNVFPAWVSPLGCPRHSSCYAPRLLV